MLALIRYQHPRHIGVDVVMTDVIATVNSIDVS